MSYNNDEIGNQSDGYHTFNELYEHRNLLFLMLCAYAHHDYEVIKSKLHHDGTMFDDSFIVMIKTDEGQISYHLPMAYWSLATHIPTVEKAWEWDGHTPNDVINRLIKSLINIGWRLEE